MNTEKDIQKIIKECIDDAFSHGDFRRRTLFGLAMKKNKGRVDSGLFFDEIDKRLEKMDVEEEY